MSQADFASSSSHVLSRVISGHPDTMPEAAAEYWASFQLPPVEQERLQSLAAKHQRGEATSEEQEEISQFQEVIELVDLLKAKALRDLQQLR